ncbi:MAG: endo alpha-1,4 polygalactosaminidase [Candidatus Hodarchaeota archaeon]
MKFINNAIFSIFFLFGFLCSGSGLVTADFQGDKRDYRQDMRNFVQDISSYARNLNEKLLIIPQNGHELLTETGEPGGLGAGDYHRAIDGVGREDLFYGYSDDNIATPDVVNQELIQFMDRAEVEELEVLVTDYCSTESFVDHSYSENAARGYTSFAADSRALDRLPEYPDRPYNENAMNITSLDEAKNFLYLINPSLFSTKEGFLDTLRATTYDLIIMDLFYEEGELNQTEIASLKIKANGGATRLIIAYMSIGEAEDYRYYWESSWETAQPSWLVEENPDWEGNYKVQYWDSNWQDIFFGNEDSYARRIVEAGFDGIYLDIIDAYEYFEENHGKSEDKDGDSNPIAGFSLVISVGALITGVILVRKRN